MCLSFCVPSIHTDPEEPIDGLELLRLRPGPRERERTLRIQPPCSCRSLPSRRPSRRATENRKIAHELARLHAGARIFSGTRPPPDPQGPNRRLVGPGFHELGAPVARASQGGAPRARDRDGRAGVDGASTDGWERLSLLARRENDRMASPSSPARVGIPSRCPSGRCRGSRGRGSARSRDRGRTRGRCE